MSDLQSVPPPARLGLLALAIFAANLGLSVIFPLIPHLAAEGPGQVGWIFSSYAFTLVIAQVLGGVLADRLTGSRVLRGALWLYFLTLLGFVFSRSLPALMLNRALEGLAVGLVVPSVMQLVVNGVSAERLGRSMGFVMGLGGIGFIIGPLLGGYLAQWGLQLPFLAAAAIAGIAASAATLGLPRVPAPISGESLPVAARSELARLGSLLTTPAFLGLVLPLMALKVNFATLQAGLPIFGEQRLGAGLVQVSYLFVVTALAYGLVQPFAGRAADRWSTRRLLTLTFLSMAPVLALMAVQRQYWVFLPVYAVFSVLQSAGVLFAMKHLGSAIGEGANGRSFGLASAIGDMGMIVAPSALLPLYSWHAEALFAGLGLLALIFLGGFWALSGPTPTPQPRGEAL